MNPDIVRIFNAAVGSSSKIDEILDVSVPEPENAAREYLELLKRTRRSKNARAATGPRLRHLAALFGPVRIELAPSLARGDVGSISGYDGGTEGWALGVEMRQGDWLSPEDVDMLDRLRVKVSQVGPEWWVEILGSPLGLRLEVSIDDGASWIAAQEDDLEPFVLVARMQSSESPRVVLLRPSE